MLMDKQVSQFCFFSTQEGSVKQETQQSSQFCFFSTKMRFQNLKPQTTLSFASFQPGPVPKDGATTALSFASFQLAKERGSRPGFSLSFASFQLTPLWCNGGDPSLLVLLLFNIVQITHQSYQNHPLSFASFQQRVIKMDCPDISQFCFFSTGLWKQLQELRKTLSFASFQPRT